MIGLFARNNKFICQFEKGKRREEWLIIYNYKFWHSTFHRVFTEGTIPGLKGPDQEMALQICSCPQKSYSLVVEA